LTFRYYFGKFNSVMNSKVINCSKALLVTTLILFSTITPAGAFKADATHPFDLSKIPMDDNWEDTGIVEKVIEPCGGSIVYLGVESIKDERGETTGWKIRIRDMATGAIRASEIYPDLPANTFVGCTPDSRYLLLDKDVYEESGGGFSTGSMLGIYDTATMQVVKALPHPHSAKSRFQHLSPDGRYLAWYTDEEIVLPDGRKIKAIPILPEFHDNLTDFAWSGDSRKVYFLTMSAPQRIIIHDLETGHRRAIALFFGKRKNNYAVVELLVHPLTGMVYLRAGLAYTGDVISREYLFMLDPAQIPDNGETVTIRPKLLGDMYATIAFGPDNTLLFSLMPYEEWDSPSFPKEYNGIFVADLNGKVLRRITKDFYALEPQYMKEREFLVLRREIYPYPEEIYTTRYYSVIYRRKTATPR
jgi:hypothetical protein